MENINIEQLEWWSNLLDEARKNELEGPKGYYQGLIEGYLEFAKCSGIISANEKYDLISRYVWGC